MERQKLITVCLIIVALGTIVQGANIEVLDSCSARVRINCQDQDCEYSAVWHVRGDEIQFTVTATTTGWVAIGFSDTPNMLNSDIVVGATDGTNSFVEERNVFDERVEPQLEAIDENVTSLIERVDGVTELKFTRPRATADDRSLTSPVFLIFAWGGTVNYGTDIVTIGQHAVNNRAFSAENFTFPDLPTECPPGCEGQVPRQYLYRQDCVETCPRPTATTPYIGNHETGFCEELLTQDAGGGPLAARLNATRYSGEVTTGTEIGTQVAYYSIIINTAYFTFVQSALLTAIRNDEIESMLKILLPNGLEVNVGSVTSFPDYPTAGSGVVFYYLDLSIVLTEQPTTIGTTLELDIASIVAGITATGFDAVNSAALLTVDVVAPLNPCDSFPCMNGGTCTRLGDTVFQCDCPAGNYSGDTCEILINQCLLDPCENGGSCTTVGETDYTCSCTVGYTGVNCSSEVDFCLNVDCQNGVCQNSGAGPGFECICDNGYNTSESGICDVDINECADAPCVNGICFDEIGDFRCECDAGFTGSTCDQNIDFCLNNNCSGLGTQLCMNGTTSFICVCILGFTGTRCETNIDDCDPDPCANGATCVDRVGSFTCECPDDRTGSLCELDETPCDPNPCLQNGTCNTTGLGTFVCTCQPGFTGDICQVDIDNCFGDPCNNGTCTDIGDGFTCQCLTGYSGPTCLVDLDFCTDTTCLNNGTCVDGVGADINCICLPGYTGFNCFVDEDVCTMNTNPLCNNGGTCIDGAGLSFSCMCTLGFDGMMCENDRDFCNESTCLNGGNCSEGLGIVTTCACPNGYTGENCGTNVDFCLLNPGFCQNGGTCVDGEGPNFTCNCSFGFSEVNCSRDDDFCDTRNCNNGTCVEGIGPETSCDCFPGYGGDSCGNDLNFCDQLQVGCQNGGTCEEGPGNITNCICSPGYSGDTCQTDLDFCNTTDPCMNGGNCLEGPGTITTCDCIIGYTGENCSVNIDFCPLNPNFCQNGGTCVDGEGPNFTCICLLGYTGESCGTNIDFCLQNPTFCQNGGICVDGDGSNFTCDCLLGFSEVNCSRDDDFCDTRNCNNGSCVEGVGPETSCDCFPGYGGDSCTNDLDFCNLINCQNGGTCEEGPGNVTNCICAPGYSGDTCQTDLDLCDPTPCLNGGTCSQVNNTYMCNCPFGFMGMNCSIDIQVCTPQTCQNGGTCIEGEGATVNCTCVDGWAGTICDVDDPLFTACSTNSCLNGGQCMEEEGPATSCDCLLGYGGVQCENDLEFCNMNGLTCLNGGTCREGEGPITSCDCAAGYSGDNCSTDLDFCNVVPLDFCQNGGTCVEGNGTIVTCNCAIGYNESDCSNDIDDFCQPEFCLNGGTCREGVGPLTSCDCVAGYSGDNCSTDLDFCNVVPLDFCQNGGTCVEGNGTNVTCNCAIGYNESDCSNDIDDFCQPEFCLNGGTCREGVGPLTSCDCIAGYSGDNCSTDLDFCDVVLLDFCQNGGTCVEGNGTIVTCNCAIGYNESDCSNDIDDFCQPEFCLNGGTCREGVGPLTSCDCVAGYSGDNCSTDLDFCNVVPLDFCQNGGTCVEGNGTIVTCNCAIGYNESDCSNDIDDFCQPQFCLNGGTCREGAGPLTSCDCAAGFSGDNCSIDLDFCNVVPSDFCQNGGTCVEGIGTIITCNCAFGYNGLNCSNDIDDFCQPQFCMNGGTCREEVGPETSCDCTVDFSGPNCTIPLTFCMQDSCQNGGTCIEQTGMDISCNCPDGWAGMFCEVDDPNFMACSLNDPCINGGTCMEREGPATSCVCSARYNGSICENDFCDPNPCFNGGTCINVTNDLTPVCMCPPGFTGPLCAEIDICTPNPCSNGGTCQVVSLDPPDLLCACPVGFTGQLCETEQPSPCQPDTCQNGGTCEVGVGETANCICATGFIGDRCEFIDPCIANPCIQGSCESNGDTAICICFFGYTGLFCDVQLGENCSMDADCPGDGFCQTRCPSDSYPSHTSLIDLQVRVDFDGTAFVRASPNQYPDLSGQVSLFITFRQSPGSRGYLFFQGTSGDIRNFAVYLDGTGVQRIWFYYTDANANLMSVNFEAFFSDGETHYFALTYNNETNSIIFYLDDVQIHADVLNNPDFQVSPSSNDALLVYVGARAPRHFRFIGQISMVVFFREVIREDFIQQLRLDYSSLIVPVGQCLPLLEEGITCTTPTVALSSLCSSEVDRCSRSFRCLPEISGSFSCQLPLPECLTDSDCVSVNNEYFCGRELPLYGDNFFRHPTSVIPGDTLYLQQANMTFDGTSIVHLPASNHPQLAIDLTIFAVVCQVSGNDGYIVGKGTNDRMRDFGLYLRSTRSTVWLAYGAQGSNNFREILFFYNVNVADGNCHSVAAVVDGSGDKAVLYVDGKAVGVYAPLPSFPEFRPGYNTLYVGGRPSTRLFRFRGDISNLFVSTAPFSAEDIVNLHNQAFAGGTINPVSTRSTVRYCTQYRRDTESCLVENSDINDFRCLVPSECVPTISRSVFVDLPPSVIIPGVCIDPERCAQCSSATENPVCGADGRTYENSCFRDCANAGTLHSGACFDYVTLCRAASLC